MWTLFYRNYLVWKQKLVPFAALHIIAPLCLLYGFINAFQSYVPYTTNGTYLDFVTTGLALNAAAIGAMWATTYTSIIKLIYSHYYLSVLATGTSVKEIIAGEILWNAACSTLIGFLVITASFLLRDDIVWTYFATIPILLLTSAATAAMGMFVLSCVYRHGDIMPFEALATALFVFSGVFVQTDIFPEALITIAAIFPLYHGIILIRSLFDSTDTSVILLHTVYLITFFIVMFTVAVHRIKKRLFT